MKNKTSRLFAGDLVDVKTPGEILRTLDADGALDGLPFMPEMMQSCGKRFRVRSRVVKTCYYTIKGNSGMRSFRGDDVVVLEDVRCSGAEHDGCQKACLIFWREAWLQKVAVEASPSPLKLVGSEQLRARLKTSTGPKTYFCQASEILRATDPLTRWGRFGKCFEDVRAGNCNSLQMVVRLGVWVSWKIRETLLGGFKGEYNKLTPMESLDLQPGEEIEVKSLKSITKTLDGGGHLRGLSFMPGMRSSCGQPCRVDRKVEKIIVDGTGEMRQLRNTVYLKGSNCGCAYVAFGGCPRGELALWREAWLRRSSGS